MPKPTRSSSTPPAVSVQAGDGSVGIGGNVANSSISVINQQIIEKQLAAALFAIPLPVRDFTGRAKELEALKASFRGGALITGVSGGGGVGKTELARKLAHDLAQDYPDARLEINLRGADPSPLAPEDAMRRLLEPFYPGEKLPDDPNQLRWLYHQTFAERKCLLLLDNAAHAALGEARRAIDFYEQALAVTQEIGDRRAAGSILGNLGSAYADLGEARKAIDFYEQQLALHREIGDRHGEGSALANMGVAYKNLGDKEMAKRLWQQALAIFRAIESPHVKTVERWLKGL